MVPQPVNIDLFIENFASFTFLKTLRIGDMETARDFKYRLIEAALKEHPSLKSLIFSADNIVNTWNLTNNSRDLKDLFPFLENNKNLTSIDISFTNSNQESFDGFVNAIEKNSTLTKVVIQNITQYTIGTNSVTGLLANNITIKDFSFVGVYMSPIVGKILVVY